MRDWDCGWMRNINSPLLGFILNGLQDLQAMVDMGEAGTTYTFQPDNNDAPTALITTIPLPYNTTGSPIEGQIDLLLEDKVLMGEGKSFTVAPSVPVEMEDMTPKLTVITTDGATTEYKPEDAVPQLYAQQDNCS